MIKKLMFHLISLLVSHGVLLSLRVHVPNNWVLRFCVIVILVQVSGKYVIIWYLDP